jgi:GNAT superfamily N-acetyltransferase
MTSGTAGVTVHPATADRWPDLERLFGAKGACGGCWCMVWRLSRSEFDRMKGDGNRAALRAIVEAGEMPGVLAYIDDQPAGWCAVAPREAYPVLARSRILKPVDERPVWSVTCLFVAKPFRRQGISVHLLRAAAEFAGAQGAHIVEGYPVEPREPGFQPDPFVWTGLASAFRDAGFEEVFRRSETRPIMRRYLASTG